MRPLRPPRTGNTHATPHKTTTANQPFLALEDLPPLAGVKLVRPRRYAAAGAPAWPLAARREDPGSCEEDPEEQSPQPGGTPSHQARSLCPLDSGGPYGCRDEVRVVDGKITPAGLASWT